MYRPTGLVPTRNSISKVLEACLVKPPVNKSAGMYFSHWDWQSQLQNSYFKGYKGYKGKKASVKTHILHQLSCPRRQEATFHAMTTSVPSARVTRGKMKDEKQRFNQGSIEINRDLLQEDLIDFYRDVIEINRARFLRKPD
eukprot:1149540-Pelagomonas_calceolata.AAC.1